MYQRANQTPRAQEEWRTCCEEGTEILMLILIPWLCKINTLKRDIYQQVEALLIHSLKGHKSSLFKKENQTIEIQN